MSKTPIKSLKENLFFFGEFDDIVVENDGDDGAVDVGNDRPDVVGGGAVCLVGINLAGFASL